MKILIIFAISLFMISSISSLKLFLKNSINLEPESFSRKIDEHFIQEIANGITNGLVPRLVLAKQSQDYLLIHTKNASSAGESIMDSIKLDLPDDLRAIGFASLWQVCESNGAALSPALNQFAQQIRMENELRQELSSSVSAAKLSAWVLAGLPIFGILLATFLGVNTLKWLASSNLGNYIIMAALILEILGILWVNRIISRIENMF
jgi:hypothetical protein